jgi:hypothetical protein
MLDYTSINMLEPLEVDASLTCVKVDASFTLPALPDTCPAADGPPAVPVAAGAAPKQSAEDQCLEL